MLKALLLDLAFDFKPFKKKTNNPKNESKNMLKISATIKFINILSLNSSFYDNTTKIKKHKKIEIIIKIEILELNYLLLFLHI